MENEDIRRLIKDACLKQWKLAERLGISESTLVRKLRKELNTEEKEIIKKEIEKYEEERRHEQYGI